MDDNATLLANASEEELFEALKLWEVYRDEITNIGEELLPYIQDSIIQISLEITRRKGESFRSEITNGAQLDSDIIAAIRQGRVDLLGNIHPNEPR